MEVVKGSIPKPKIGRPRIHPKRERVKDECDGWAKSAKRKCRNEAGWNTDHFGVGKCAIHGGKTPVKHGRYSKVARAKIGEIYDRLAEDPDPLNIEPELVLMRAHAEFFLDKYGPTPAVLDMLDRATKVADLLKKHRDTSKLTLESVSRVIESLGAVVLKHVKDPKILAKIDKDWALIQIV